MAGHSVLLVIPTLNESKNIKRVISELNVASSSDLDLLIVVADGGSSDDTPNIVRNLSAEDARIHYLDNPDIIQSAAVNLAVTCFGEGRDFLIRCDAHASYPKNYIRNILTTFDRIATDAVVVPIDSVGHSCLQKAIAWVSDMSLGSGGSAHRGGTKSGFVDHGHHAGFRLETFVRLGGYDASFSHNEDAEYDCRQRRAGGRIYLDADIRVKYWPRTSVLALWRQYFAYGFGRCQTVLRHPTSLRFRQLVVPINLIVMIGSLAIACFDRLSLFWPLIYFSTLGLVSIYILLKKRSVCGLLSGLAACIMHTAWACGFLCALCKSGRQLLNRAPAQKALSTSLTNNSKTIH